MKVRILKKSVIRTEEFYEDFLEDRININDDYFENEVIYIDQAPDFPIYMGRGSTEEKEEDFIEAFDIIAKYYIKTERDIHMNEMFWYSLFCTQKREYILEKYPQIKESQKEFENVVLKKFDWENYVYKCVLATEYLYDKVDDTERYLKLILDNLDLYNYILKYQISRNSDFLIKILNIIERRDLGKILKAKIKNRPDLGKDPRYGRMVIFEFNKSYPIIMVQDMEEDELEELFMKYLSYYYDISKIV